MLPLTVEGCPCRACRGWGGVNLLGVGGVINGLGKRKDMGTLHSQNIGLVNNTKGLDRLLSHLLEYCYHIR